MLERYGDIQIQLIAPKAIVDSFCGFKNVIVGFELTDHELRDAYRGASCLLMPLDGATANNAILEAMACGLPIVSEDIGGVAEYTGRSCARLCPPGSAESLVEAILKLYEDGELAASMRRCARERAREFDWPIVAERTRRLYEDVLRSRI
jgi:glycosyltransferase involved in cell wall biosynthesis